MSHSAQTVDPESLWAIADWDALRSLGPADLAGSEDRARGALFVAAAHMHFGDMFASTVMCRQALEWGATRQSLIAILASGLHNTAGRIALLMQDNQQASTHFEASIRAIKSNTSTPQVVFARRFHEMVNLGLMPDAAKALSVQRSMMRSQDLETSWAAVLDSKIELLNHTLSLAIQRGQLTQHASERVSESSVEDYAKAHSTAQLGQDVWVLEQTGFKRGGYFIEFGATNGILLSNTYLLETGFDWTGICAEPNPTFFTQLERNRNCTVIPDCIAGESGKTVRFIAADEYGGVEEFGDDDNHREKRAAYAAQGHVLDLKTVSLNDVLEAHGAPKDIDYLSIDTEGSEYDILASFPFDKWNIRLITVEHNFTPMRDQIAELLEANGYIRTKAQWDDWYAKAEN